MNEEKAIDKIIHGDCLEYIEKMSDDSVDIVFTSPPYNRKRNDKYAHYEDIVENWYEWQKEIITELLRITKRTVFYNIQTNYYNRTDVYKIIGHFAEDIREIIVWEKSNPMPASGINITNALEYFLVLGSDSLKSNSTYTKNIITTSVNSKMPKEHKAVMKPEVAEWFIEKFTKEGDIILDPFAGIGTTGRACEKIGGRKYIMIEKQKEYIDIIKQP